MPLILPNVPIFIRTCSILKRNSCVPAMLTGVGNLLSTLVRLPTWKVPVETIPKVMHGSTLGMCNMMCRGLLSYSAENKLLDSLFSLKLETTQADVTGLIGQYAHGNEPSHHITYLYTLAGRPERTQELIREIFDTQYHPEPDGLCGNDDCGQMSAWYMFSAMGFYPVDPVSGNYVFGAPQMPEIVLNLADGKTFTIIAEGLSKEHKYVDSITLNGEPYTKNYISHEDILKGGTLVYKMK